MSDADAQPSNAGDRWTVKRVLDWTLSHLKQHGSDTPRLDAEVLLAHARGCKRVQLYTQYDFEMTPAHRAVMRDLVKRRANHEPVAYLVGYREFFSLKFHVTPDVLIPRPETESLVVELIEAAREMPEVRILDIGTGSGCIAVAAAVNLPNASLTAVDLSEPALAVALENATSHNVADRITLLHGDLFSPVDVESRFDFIISNPPYVTESEYDTLAPDIREHEPRTALVSGADGLDTIRRIVVEAPDHLLPGGRLLIELDPQQAETVCGLTRSDDRYADVAIIKDMNREARGIAATAH